MALRVLGLRFAASAALAASIALLVSVADAKSGSTSLTYKETAIDVSVASVNGYPNIGGRSTELALVTVRFVPRTGKPFRVSGVHKGVSVVTGRPSESSFTAKGTGRTYFCNGTIAMTNTVTVNLGSDGIVTFEGTGRLTGGTGALRGARGTFKLTGSGKVGEPLTVNSTGSQVYRGAVPCSAP